MRPQPLRIATLVVLLAALALGVAEARKVKVWKYETRDGRIDYGTEIPEGAVALEEVGEVERADGEAGGSAVPPAGASAALPRPTLTDVERVLETLSRRPVVFGCFVAAVFLWAVVLLRIFAAAFRTLEMSWDRAVRLVLTILAGIAVLALAGQALEWVWLRIGWSPRVAFGASAMATLAWTLYALVALVVFRKRLGVGLAQAALLASLWFALVVGAAALIWIYVVAATTIVPSA